MLREKRKLSKNIEEKKYSEIRHFKSKKVNPSVNKFVFFFFLRKAQCRWWCPLIISEKSRLKSLKFF